MTLLVYYITVLINSNYSEIVLVENKLNQVYTKFLQGIYIQASVFTTIKLDYSVYASSSFSFNEDYKPEIYYLSHWLKSHSDNRPPGHPRA